MNLKLIPLFVVVILFSRCANGEIDERVSKQSVDTIPPQVKIIGQIKDTAYLYSSYKDRGVDLLDEVEGELRCPDDGCTVEINGNVNTQIPGLQFIKYIGKDASGNQALAITRTVVVMDNSTTFLNGNYNVAFTCTTTISGSSPKISAENYTASVSSSSIKDQFELNWLKFGSAFTIPSVFLKENYLEVHIPFLNGYDWNQSHFKGSLSSDKNSFTIESFCVNMNVPGGTTYKCKNVYTRMVIIK